MTCVGNLTIIVSDNGLLPGWCQSIIWTNDKSIVNWTIDNKLLWNLNLNSNIFTKKNAFENVVWEMSAILSQPQFVNWFHSWASTSWIEVVQGLYSLSGKTSYGKSSWSLEAARFGFRLFQSLWNLTGTSAAALPRCLSNFRMLRLL